MDYYSFTDLGRMDGWVVQGTQHADHASNVSSRTSITGTLLFLVSLCMHLLAFGIYFLPHSVNLSMIILFLTLLNPILLAHLSHHHHHFPSLLLFSTLNSKGTFSLKPLPLRILDCSMVFNVRQKTDARPSVRLSHAGIVSIRLNLSSNCLHCLVAPWF